MVIPNLGSLVEVELRDAWNHEAHSFTPWLAEHLHELAKQIGIPLELEGQEVPVAEFSADILARNPQDDTLVLIENQLEGSDHLHLGQIMTYLAGLEAHTIVWIAADFREPHISALNWLNENTGESFAFFAVKVKAVRIGDSPIAPVFEVITRPNHWERKLHAIAQETRNISKIGQFRQEFWTYYVNRFPTEQAWGDANAASSRWRVFDDIGLVVTVYLAREEVGVFIRGLRGIEGAEVYARLMPYCDRLQAETGVSPGSSNRGHHYFVKTLKCQYHDQSQWERLTDWLHSTANTYEALLKNIFGEESNAP
ncbi:hypothetical protein K4A83_10455 [Spirulina subsalsa FACHB-351]|uniref:DUF4268 domain-containing protein n=1 Tax=Spirulina subsalsa FACHB-351 TaxID=234711 RepID=A0ABT3L5A0_9CYAN|nr:hypothetical protein [Spirulina subsalsa]MCW6036680.1 hypothetical protein [Spirulina subsalsa FACHB-351]